MNDAERVEELIRTKTFGSMGNSGRPGQPYQESYFGDAGELGFKRGGSRARLEAITRNLDVKGKLVLDVGCNIGFFCFGLAAAGASAIGVDYDQDSIDVATASAHSHSVSGVRFVRAAFDARLAAQLVADHGVPDVILLNSVVHWLMYAHDSVRDVARAFEPLLSSEKKQYIVYEPSSTGLAYYPELLSEAGISDFFLSLGVLEYRSIGEFFADNANQKRMYLLGERDVQPALGVALKVLTPGGEWSPEFKQAFGTPETVVRKQNKINVLTDRVVVKTHPLGRAGARAMLQNEADCLRAFASAHSPQLVVSGNVGESFVLVCKREPGADLQSQWIDSADVPLIEQQLSSALGELRDAGLAHNDIRPQNVLWSPSEKHLTLLDFEFCSRLCRLPPEQANAHLREQLAERMGSDDRSYLDDRLFHLGGKWRSSYGLATTENDRYAAKKVVFSLKNRRSYYKHRILQSVSALVPRPVRALLRSLGPAARIGKALDD